MRSFVRWLNWVTEKSAASEACLPSFPTIPTPESRFQMEPIMDGRMEGNTKLTDVGSLNHTNIVSTITDAAYTFHGMLPNKTSDVSLLSRRAPARNHSGELGSDFDELVLEQVQTKLNRHVSPESPECGWNPDLERFPIDDKTAIQFRLQKLQLIPNLVRSLDYSPGCKYTKCVSLNQTSPWTRYSRFAT